MNYEYAGPKKIGGILVRMLSLPFSKMHKDVKSLKVNKSNGLFVAVKTRRCDSPDPLDRRLANFKELYRVAYNLSNQEIEDIDINNIHNCYKVYSESILIEEYNRKTNTWDILNSAQIDQVKNFYKNTDTQLSQAERFFKELYWRFWPSSTNDEASIQAN